MDVILYISIFLGDYNMARFRRVMTFAVLTMLCGSKIAQSRLYYEWDTRVASGVTLGNSSGGVDMPFVS